VACLLSLLVKRMGRGKHLSTKKKEMRVLMTAMMEGIAKGELAATKKKYKLKNIPYIFLKKFDELQSDQIFKFVSILGVAWIIKSGIDWTQEIFRKFLTLPFPFGLGIRPGDGTGPPVIKLGEDTEFAEWLISFMAAYLIVENFGEIVTAGGSVLSLANTLLLGMA